jgi:hypothetical protein
MNSVTHAEWAEGPNEDDEDDYTMAGTDFETCTVRDFGKKLHSRIPVVPMEDRFKRAGM